MLIAQVGKLRQRLKVRNKQVLTCNRGSNLAISESALEVVVVNTCPSVGQPSSQS